MSECYMCKRPQTVPGPAVKTVAAMISITWLGKGQFSTFVLHHFYNMIIIISNTGFSVECNKLVYLLFINFKKLDLSMKRQMS